MMADADEGGNSGISMDSRVLVYPGTDHEKTGVIVEDFADTAGKAVDIGEHHIADAARRWAVALDDGGLVFVDDDSLTAEPTS
ncbi:hypothetical protein [Mycolicibacterium litorale]|uniref:Uncharacterized protein n=2 Tax=Mycolicibacterium litorale TaxID=758802 RepID=A0AAD1IMW8_9MYCO|nr:hypothetical protein [Mycolicibacterium litorale]MCV7418691.1 hypothetical protein [Mycolicibacterium litorale]TDY05911.1 hypothetical protein BCL50_2220 [Mycolicibacterium litorale]BBY14583.1 hypothetical protein MLIT_01750 [Mycolicibacterium litorale]